MNATRIKEKLQKGASVFGPFIKADSTALVEILGHTGFDYVLLDMEHSPVSIGPYDLSQSLGIPGQVDDARVVDKIGQIVADVARAGKSLGIYVDDPATARKYQAMGIRFITLCVDTTIFYRACEALHAELRSAG